VTPDLSRRRSLLTAALGFARLDTRGKPAEFEGTAVIAAIYTRTSTEQNVSDEGRG
jgi:hypothetical protein